ncbi:MAG: hypothetical protein MAG431_01963 [Chloroflexi bacterium]|nr:hypothetical protein [Chloroflexota bacterium]
MMKSESGTYILILHPKEATEIQVGVLGDFSLASGFYLYVGSAHGPGGVAARVNRHLSPRKKLHWHIDYLTKQASIFAVWYAYGVRKFEHSWAKVLGQMTGAESPMVGFGSSDCACPTHLFYFPQKPSLEEFQDLTQNQNLLTADLAAPSPSKPLG